MAPATAPATLPGPAPEKKSALETPARLVVELPADAKLFVDDQLMKTSSARRIFNTPALQVGQTYYYILRAEVEIDGKPVAETKRVLVRAGEEVKANFAELAAAARKKETVVAADAGR
jgi:uncharacterized protein (TIGR03000 family)